MLESFFRFLRPVWFYALLLLLPLGWFAWGTATGTRLLGDDNESTETLNVPGSGGHRGGSSGGHARFYHK